MPAPFGGSHDEDNPRLPSRLSPLSHKLAKVLRHEAPTLGLTPLGEGWYKLEEVMKLRPMQKEKVSDVREVVDCSFKGDRQRFELEKSGYEEWIRATPQDRGKGSSRHSGRAECPNNGGKSDWSDWSQGRSANERSSWPQEEQWSSNSRSWSSTWWSSDSKNKWSSWGEDGDSGSGWRDRDREQHRDWNDSGRGNAEGWQDQKWQEQASAEGQEESSNAREAPNWNAPPTQSQAPSVQENHSGNPFAYSAAMADPAVQPEAVAAAMHHTAAASSSAPLHLRPEHAADDAQQQQDTAPDGPPLRWQRFEDPNLGVFFKRDEDDYFQVENAESEGWTRYEDPYSRNYYWFKSESEWFWEKSGVASSEPPA